MGVSYEGPTTDQGTGEFPTPGPVTYGQPIESEVVDGVTRLVSTGEYPTPGPVTYGAPAKPAPASDVDAGAKGEAEPDDEPKRGPGRPRKTGGN